MTIQTSAPQEKSEAAARGCGLRLAIALAMAALIATPIWLWYAFVAETQKPYAKAQFAHQVVTLARGVHMLGRLEPSVAYAIETSDGVVLVDSGLDADASAALAQLRSLGIGPKQIRAILLTHAHGDHVFGAGRLREVSGAKIYCGAGDADVVVAGDSRDAFFSTFPMDRTPLHATPVDVRLAGGEKIEVGDTTIEAIHAPGHTPGSTCYLLERDGERILFGGDVISSLVGDLGIYSVYLAPRYRGNAGDYLKTLRRFREQPAPDVVLPGHPHVGEPHGPRLSNDRWRSLLDDNIRTLEMLVARHEADGRDFLDGEPKKLLKDLYYLGDVGDRALYCLRGPLGDCLFDAPGGEQGDVSLVKTIAERFEKLSLGEPKLTAVLLTSTDGAAIAGLRDLVQATNCRVLAAPEGEAAARAACPEGAVVLPATPENLQSVLAATQVVFLPLGGRGASPAAYALELEGKRVLVSGRMPVKGSEKSMGELLADLRAEGGDFQAYDKSLELLEERYKSAPLNLWLPAVPLHGQNANLYGDEWSKLIAENKDFIYAPIGQPSF